MSAAAASLDLLTPVDILLQPCHWLSLSLSLFLYQVSLSLSLTHSLSLLYSVFLSIWVHFYCRWRKFCSQHQHIHTVIPRFNNLHLLLTFCIVSTSYIGSLGLFQCKYFCTSPQVQVWIFVFNRVFLHCYYSTTVFPQYFIQR